MSETAERVPRGLPAAFRQYECGSCPLSTLKFFRPVSDEQAAFVRRFKRGEALFAAGALILREGEKSNSLYTVLQGWGIRSKVLSDGRRQILNFVMPGDFIGLQTSVFGEAEHSLEALTEMRVCVFDRERFWEVYENNAELGYELTWIAARELQVLDISIVSLGQRNALERTAHLLLDLFRRGCQRGLTENGRLPFPVTQQHLADALGMSLVHTNKTLRRLQELGVIRLRSRDFHLLDEPRLAEIARWEEGDEEEGRRPYL